MQSFWNKKYVLITGAGSGIGKALASNLAKQGAQLILTDINKQTLETVSQELGVSVVHHEVSDISQKDHWQKLAYNIEAKIGYLDVLVNNAGMSPFGFFEETSEELFDKVMAVNFSGVVHGCRIMQPLLEKSKRGMIANISSIFGIITVPMITSYHASKFAVRGFTEALRQDFKYQNKNIDVVCVMPGGIKTNIANAAEVAGNADIDFAAHFNKIAMTSPNKAAKIIERGMRQNRFRILIGPDAKLVSLLQRLLPGSYSKVFNPLMGVNRLINF